MSGLSRILPRSARLFASASSNLAAPSPSPSPSSSLQGSTDPTPKVFLPDVHSLTLRLLTSLGPLPRRSLFHDHISLHLPIHSNVPNQPPRALWQRKEDEKGGEAKVLTPSMWKKEVVRRMLGRGEVETVTVRRVRKAWEARKQRLALEGGEGAGVGGVEGMTERQVERAVRNLDELAESDFVLVAKKWWNEFAGREEAERREVEDARPLRRVVR